VRLIRIHGNKTAEQSMLAHLGSGREVATVVRSHDSGEIRDSAVGKSERQSVTPTNWPVNGSKQQSGRNSSRLPSVFPDAHRFPKLSKNAVTVPGSEQLYENLRGRSPVLPLRVRLRKSCCTLIAPKRATNHTERGPSARSRRQSLFTGCNML